jgi:hypothetical protein
MYHPIHDVRMKQAYIGCTVTLAQAIHDIYMIGDVRDIDGFAEKEPARKMSVL